MSHPAQQVLVEKIAFVEKKIATNGRFGEMAIAGKFDAADMKRIAPVDAGG